MCGCCVQVVCVCVWDRSKHDLLFGFGNFGDGYMRCERIYDNNECVMRERAQGMMAYRRHLYEVSLRRCNHSPCVLLRVSVCVCVSHSVRDRIHPNYLSDKIKRGTIVVTRMDLKYRYIYIYILQLGTRSRSQQMRSKII